MKKLLLCVFVLAALGYSAPPAAQQCEELKQKTAAKLHQIDQVMQLRTGQLLGEMKSAQGALEGCVTQNRLVETRASLLWFLTDGVFLLLGGLLWAHHRKMKKAVLGLSARLHKAQPEHPSNYMPSQWVFRVLLFTMVGGFTLTNLVALFL